MVVLQPALNPLQDVLNQINLLLRLRQPRFQPTQRHTQTWWEVGRRNIETNHSHPDKASLGLPGTWISGNHGLDDVIQDPSQAWNIFKVQAQIKKGFANSRVVPELSHACVEDGNWNRPCHGWSRVESTKSYLIDIIMVRQCRVDVFVGDLGQDQDISIRIVQAVCRCLARTIPIDSQNTPPGCDFGDV